MTVSLLAADSELTVVATATCYPSVGTIVPAVSDAAAAVSQANGGPKIAAAVLAEVSSGRSAQAAVDAAVADFPRSESRQVVAVAADGSIGQHTGDEALPARGVLTTSHAAICGNMLTEGTLESGMSAFLSGRSENRLSRAVTALEAAFAAGGDVRGIISSALRAQGIVTHYGITLDVGELEVRVDWAEEPVSALRSALTQKLSYLLVELLGDMSRPLPAGLEELESLEVLAGFMLGEDPDGSAAILLCRNVISERLGEGRAGKKMAELLAERKPGPGCTRETVEMLWR